jgi:serine protease Do
MNTLSVVLFSLLLAGCATTNLYQKFYVPSGDPRQLRDAQFLAAGQEPELYQANSKEDMEVRVRGLARQNYASIGYSSFIAPYEDFNKAIEHAKYLRAVALIILNPAYTHTDTMTMPLPVPTAQSTRESGTVTAGSARATYRGSSTTYGSEVVPVTTQRRNYQQGAVYFIKDTKRYRFGFEVSNLTPEQRQTLGRNTGAAVVLVFDKSPVFYANILEGDVIVSIDGMPVRNGDKITTIIDKIPADATSSKVTVLRSGVEKEVGVRF